MEKGQDWRDILDFQRCERPNGTHYGTAGQCRKGAPVDPREAGITAENWRDLGSVYGSETTAAVAAISANLEKLTPAQREPWEKAIPEMCVDTKICTATSRKDPVTGKEEIEPESSYDGQMASRILGYNKMLADGPPSNIELRNGDIVPAGNLQPTVSLRGGARWVDPETTLKYTHKGKDVATQTGYGKLDRARRIDDATAYRDASKGVAVKNSVGKSWPRQELPKSQQLDADEIIAGLSKRERNSITFNGLSKTAHGTPQHDVAVALNKSPAMQQTRLREIVERYAAQGGVSGVSGKPVALPGLKAKPGQERSSVDHLSPISTAKSVKNGGSAGGIRKSHDNKKNFLIAEESLNSGRGDRPWSGEIDKMRAARDADLALPSKPPAPRFVGIPKASGSMPSRGATNRRAQSAQAQRQTSRRSTNAAAKRERDIAKLSRDVDGLRAKRDQALVSQGLSSLTFKKYSKQVDEKLTEKRRLENSPLN